MDDDKNVSPTKPMSARTVVVSGKQHHRIVDGIDTFTGQPSDAPGNAEQPYWERISEADRDMVRQERRAYHEHRRVSAYAERDRLIAETIQGNLTLTPKISPYQVEQHIHERFGLRCWLPGNRSDDEAIAAERWRWEVAVSWIAAQTPEGTRDGVAAFYTWQGQTRLDLVRLGQVMSFAEAETVLRKSLEAGLLRSWRSDINGAEQIPRDVWPGLEWSDAHPPIVLRAEVCRWTWTKQGFESLLERDARSTRSVMDIADFAAPPPEQLKPKGRRGPPPKKFERVRTSMLDDLRSGSLLCNEKHEAMAERYGVSRDTAMRAFRVALSEFQTSTNSDTE